jgi:hypothetical protein
MLIQPNRIKAKLKQRLPVYGVIAMMKRTNIAASITAGTREDAARQVARGAKMILAASQTLIFSGSKIFLRNKPAFALTPLWNIFICR